MHELSTPAVDSVLELLVMFVCHVQEHLGRQGRLGKHIYLGIDARVSRFAPQALSGLRVAQEIAFLKARTSVLMKALEAHGKDSCFIVTLRPGLFGGAFLRAGAF
jgi:hypothetical protein